MPPRPALLPLLLLSQATAAAPFPGCKGGTLEGCPGSANCTTRWLEQPIDHFNWAAPLGNKSRMTYQMRYFVYDKWWKWGGPIFFYVGNEDNVELYVNHTGLMWENAEEFGAMMVFAEHRYYGESLPFPDGVDGCMSWLTSEQAMADYAYLIDHLRTTVPGASMSAVIGFGGSYGGMVGAWFRVKYPNSLDGMIAASAPIWSFSGLKPPYDFNAYAKGVTRDASAAGGATDHCKHAIKTGYTRILAAARTAEGRETLQKAFRLCQPLDKPYTYDADALASTFSSGGNFANMAMGNYPYASSYLMHGKSLLPPWPMHLACSHLARDFAADEDEALFEGLREATAVQINNTGDAPCFTPGGHPARPTVESAGAMRYMGAPPEPLRRPRPNSGRGRGARGGGPSCKGSWGYQYCTEMTQPFVTGTPDDMYYCPDGTYHPAEQCGADPNTRWAPPGCDEWDVKPRLDWARVGLGGKRLLGSSNIVFSNGLLDPWHGGGVLANLSDTLVAVVIPNGAHHIDLMFSDPADAAYPDIGAAREVERQEMRRWVAEAEARRRR